MAALIGTVHENIFPTGLNCSPPPSYRGGMTGQDACMSIIYITSMGDPIAPKYRKEYEKHIYGDQSHCFP
jgi:hypothetical protein